MSNGNKNVILIMGAPNTGKTAALRHLVDQPSMMYLNTDLKELSFNKDTFMKKIDVKDATNILGFIDQIESSPKVTGVVLDTLTFAMSMYERQYVAPHAGTKKGLSAWGEYANFYGDMLHKIKSGSKDYIILAHDKCEYNEETMETESKVPVKGAVGRTGVEADFTVILSALKISPKKLKDPKFQNPMLTITEEEEEDGIKYVFQTRPYKGTGNTCRGGIGMWPRSHLYIDADANAVMQHVKAHHAA
jgi:hypothetical protein